MSKQASERREAWSYYAAPSPTGQTSWAIMRDADGGEDIEVAELWDFDNAEQIANDLCQKLNAAKRLEQAEARNAKADRLLSECWHALLRLVPASELQDRISDHLAASNTEGD